MLLSNDSIRDFTSSEHNDKNLNENPIPKERFPTVGANNDASNQCCQTCETRSLHSVSVAHFLRVRSSKLVTGRVSGRDKSVPQDVESGDAIFLLLGYAISFVSTVHALGWQDPTSERTPLRERESSSE